MQPIRVGVITFDWYPYEPRALRLARAAADAGYAVDVICIRKSREKFHELDGNTHIYRLPLKRGENSSLASKVLLWCLFVLFAGVTAMWLHFRHRYQVVHVHNMPDFLVFFGSGTKIVRRKGHSGCARCNARVNENKIKRTRSLVDCAFRYLARTYLYHFR